VQAYNNILFIYLKQATWVMMLNTVNTVSIDMPSDLWEERARTFERKFSEFCQYNNRS